MSTIFSSRGKSSGHDMDVLFALPNEEDESKLLPILLEKLEQRGLVLWSRITRDVKNGHEDIEDDKLLVCYLILKYPQDVKIEDFQEPRSEIPSKNQIVTFCSCVISCIFLQRFTRLLRIAEPEIFFWIVGLI